MSRTLRIAAVTGGLLVAGAVAGTVAAEAAFLVAAVFSHTGEVINRQSLLTAGSTGALLGGVLLPITAWIFLRRVPLGLAVLGTLLGTVVGGTLGWIFS